MAEASLPARVGVCIGGWIGTMKGGVQDGGASIQRHLLGPLGNADLLLALRYEGAGDCPTNSRADEAASQAPLAESVDLNGPLASACLRTVRRSLPKLLGTIRRLRLEPSPTLEELVTKLEALPHWPQIVRAFNSGLREPGNKNIHPKVCTRVDVWRDKRRSPYQCTNVWGSYLSPVFASNPSSYGHNLIVLRDVSASLGVLAAAERASGLRYTHVVSTRLDLQWHAPHPPIGLFDPRAVAIPEGVHAALSASVSAALSTALSTAVSASVRASDCHRR